MPKKSDQTGSAVSLRTADFRTHLDEMTRSGRAGAIQVLGTGRLDEVHDAVSFMQMKWWNICAKGQADTVHEKPSWAFRVSKNKAKKILAAILKQGRRCVRLEDEFAEVLEAPALTPQDQAVAKESAMTLSEFLDSFVASAQLRLSDEDAEIFYRRVFEEEPYSEIVVAMDMLPNTASQRLCRAMEGLADLFQKEGALDPKMADILQTILEARKPVKDVLRDLLEIYADGTLGQILDDAEAYEQDDKTEEDPDDE